MRRLRGIAPVLVPLVLCGCDDAPAVLAEGGEVADPARAAAGNWLEVHDERTPAFWLVERSAGRGVLRDDPRVAVVDARLDAAVAQFHESRRMLANRTAQVVDVAAEHGEALTPTEVLDALTFPAGGNGKQWYGALVQSYIVLRASGKTHSDAVAALRAGR